MTKRLTKLDLLSLTQKSLPDGSYAVAYFSRERKYSYYLFDSVDNIIDLLKEREADMIDHDQRTRTMITFSIDEWFVFADEKLATTAFEAIKLALPDSICSE